MFNINIRATLIEGVRAMCMNVWNLNAAPCRGIGKARIGYGYVGGARCVLR